MLSPSSDVLHQKRVCALSWWYGTPHSRCGETAVRSDHKTTTLLSNSASLHKLKKSTVGSAAIIVRQVEGCNVIKTGGPRCERYKHTPASARALLYGSDNSRWPR